MLDAATLSALFNSAAVGLVVQLLPLLIAAATLLAMVNARNTDLASRFRANVIETRRAEDSEHKRRTSLLIQNAIFFLRYLLTSVSFICFAYAVTCFALYGVKTLVPIPSEGIAAEISRLTRLLVGFHYEQTTILENGMTYFLRGLIMLVFEFFIGFITLALDGWSSLRIGVRK